MNTQATDRGPRGADDYGAMEPEHSVNAGAFGIALYVLFKLSLVFVAGMSIYLGYKLFIAGVSGAASLVVNASNVQGQLINAAPGLFFAVGGLTALIVITIKSASIKQSIVGRPDAS